MIPANLVAYVHGPGAMVITTRNEKLAPSAARVFGATVDAENDRITIFLPLVAAEDVLRDLRDNGQVAFSMGAASHESYQFKGRVVGTRPSSAQDKAVQDIYMGKLIAEYAPFGMPDEFWGGYAYDPSEAVTFQVEHVFVQTPGPGAGDEIEFERTPRGPAGED